MERAAPPILAGLDDHARFHRDSALGRIFHPGTRSYRERAALDSVHVAVTPDNRVSVHVDRVSPLVLRDGRPCRYSLGRAVVHNVFFLFELLSCFVRRQVDNRRCMLDCQIVWVPDDDEWVEPEEDGEDDAAGVRIG